MAERSAGKLICPYYTTILYASQGRFHAINALGCLFLTQRLIQILIVILCNHIILKTHNSVAAGYGFITIFMLFLLTVHIFSYLYYRIDGYSKRQFFARS